MPTYDIAKTARDDVAHLTPEQRRAFGIAIKKFVTDLQRGTGFRPGLRVKSVEGHPGVWEMTWAPDGRATFEYAEKVRAEHTHIIWRRIGTHDIFRQP